MTKKLSERVRNRVDQAKRNSIGIGFGLADQWADEIESLERQRDALLEALKLLDARGGLGLDVHKWIRDTIKSVENSNG